MTDYVQYSDHHLALRAGWNLRGRAERYASGVDRVTGVTIWFEILRRVGIVNGTLVGEIGAGPGLLAESCLAIGARVVAFDSATEMLATAPLLVRRGAAVADAMDLPIRGSVLDAVVARSFLWCVLNPAELIDELGRVLAPGGTFVSADPLYEGERDSAALSRAVDRLRRRIEDEAGIKVASAVRMADDERERGEWSPDKWSERFREVGWETRTWTETGTGEAGGPDSFRILAATSPTHDS